MKKPTIHNLDLIRFHSISRMIEDDLDEAYVTCRERYGADAAGVVLVAILREKLNKNKDQWPPPSDLIDNVNKFLQEKGLYEGDYFG